MTNMKEVLEQRFLHTYLRRCWTLARNQARHRNQEWNIPYELYKEMWTENDNWLRKGSRSNDLCFTRIDVEKPWDPDNVKLDTRSGHLLRNPTATKKEKQ